MNIDLVQLVIVVFLFSTVAIMAFNIYIAVTNKEPMLSGLDLFIRIGGVLYNLLLLANTVLVIYFYFTTMTPVAHKLLIGNIVAVWMVFLALASRGAFARLLPAEQKRTQVHGAISILGMLVFCSKIQLPWFL